MVFVSFRKKFSDNTRIQIFFFFLSCHAKCEFFLPEFNIRLYHKNSESDFFLHQNQNIFFSNIGNQNIFFEKTITPPPFKLNDLSLSLFCFYKFPEKTLKDPFFKSIIFTIFLNLTIIM